MLGLFDNGGARDGGIDYFLLGDLRTGKLRLLCAIAHDVADITAARIGGVGVLAGGEGYLVGDGSDQAIPIELA